jgi:hypothetical protein
LRQEVVEQYDARAGMEGRRELAEAGIERQWQGRQQRVLGAVLEIAGDADGAGDDVAMREHDPFRFAGTAGGIKNRRHVGVDHPVAAADTRLQEIVPVQVGQWTIAAG